MTFRLALGVAFLAGGASVHAQGRPVINGTNVVRTAYTQQR